MFDIGFSEILIVGTVALIVVGPEKLPSLIRTVLIYVRKIRDSFNSVRSEVERELDLDNLRDTVGQTQTNIKDAIGYKEIKHSIDDLKEEAESLKEYDFDVDSDYVEQNIDQDLPAPDSESDTGVEVELKSDNSK